MSPARARVGETLPVTIQGRGFLLAARVSFAERGANEVSAIFSARLDETALSPVRYLSGEALAAVVPPTLAPGVHRLVVEDPRGRRASLEAAFTVDSGSWWDAGWGYRRQLAIDAREHSEALDDFPVLVRLEPSIFDYAHAAPDGADLRFLDEDGSTLLAHEVEEWAPAGESLLWVKVPRIEAGRMAGVTLYYGNASATSIADPAAVWSASFEAVFHLGDPGDSSPTGLAGTATGTTVTAGRVGPATRFNGVDALVRSGTDPPVLRDVAAATLSAWIAPEALGVEQSLVAVSRSGGTPTPESRATVFLSPGGAVVAGGRSDDAEPLRSVTSASGAVAVSTWQWLCAVVDYTGDRVSLWVDARIARTGAATFSNARTPSTNPRLVAIGVQDDLVSGFFAGAIDEVRVASVARSETWLGAEYRSMTGALVSVGAEEARPETLP
jgi:biopolymer transport protein ExbB